MVVGPTVRNGCVFWEGYVIRIEWLAVSITRVNTRTNGGRLVVSTAYWLGQVQHIAYRSWCGSASHDNGPVCLRCTFTHLPLVGHQHRRR